MPVSEPKLMSMMEQLAIRCEAAETLRDRAEISRKEAELRCNKAEYECAISEMKNKRYKYVVKFLGISSILFVASLYFTNRSQKDIN